MTEQERMKAGYLWLDDEDYYFKDHRFADQPERTDPAPKLDFLD